MNKPDFANISNADFVDDLYRKYLADPASVGDDWRIFFAGFDLAAGMPKAKPSTNGAAPAARIVPAAPVDSVDEARHALRRGPAAPPTVGVFDLIHSYRELGHLIADLDPLGDNQTSHPLLDLSQFGLSDADRSRSLEIPSFKAKPIARVGELIDHLHSTYCGSVAVEYMSIQNKTQRDWIQERIEPSCNKPGLTAAERVDILEQVMRANMLEQFIHKKYVGAKRFSLEGAETLIPLLHQIIEESGRMGTREVVMGMPHRGRLNVLAHILGKPYEMIFSEFEGNFLADTVQGDGDVKYHLGYSRDHRTRSGSDIHLSLLFNPSHLEAINPVAEGIVAGKQHYLNDTDCSLVLPLLMHGDAAFMGQGLVMETLGLSELAGFRTGGTIHLIVNNQIGFTTSPKDYRFTRYPTEVAKLISALTLHANGDDPEAVVQAGRLAAEFRTRFHEDVLVDLVCYRRHGHNELDDPTFTQPLMYKKIAQMPTVSQRYADRLVREDVLDEAGVVEMTDRIQTEFNKALEYARDFMPKQQVFSFGGVWKGITWAGDDWSAATHVEPDLLRKVAREAAALPEGFSPHPKVVKLYADRVRMVEEGETIDWGCGEMLALGTLLLEGTCVRLSGQDSGRGTFSHRQAALHDMETGQRIVPLDRMSDEHGRFYLIDSNLSEAGVLGFEYGFASADPRNLVIWEAQFGDFANGAQVIIDQFIASAESKWQRTNGLVMLLPHGYEGARAGAFQRTTRTLFKPLRRAEHSGLQPDQPGPTLPCAAPPGPPHLPQASGDHEPEEHAAKQAVRLFAGRVHQNGFPLGARRDRGHRQERGSSRAALQRHGLLRPPRRTRRSRDQGRRHRARRAALPFPAKRSSRGAGGLPQPRRGRLGAGRAEEHGSLAFRLRSQSHDFRRRAHALLRWPRGRGQSRDGILQEASGRTSPDSRHCFPLAEGPTCGGGFQCPLMSLFLSSESRLAKEKSWFGTAPTETSWRWTRFFSN